MVWKRAAGNDDQEARFTTCWRCAGAVFWGDHNRCPRCKWAVCKKCDACRRPMFIDKTGRRGPCPREIPIFKDVLCLRWERDCYGALINWAALGKHPPLNPQANVDLEAEWLRSVRRELRLPGLTAARGGLATGYSATFTLPEDFRLLRDARAVSLVAMVLEHAPTEGAQLRVGVDRLSCRIAKPIYALIDGTQLESYDRLAWDWLDELEGDQQPFLEMMGPAR